MSYNYTGTPQQKRETDTNVTSQDVIICEECGQTTHWDTVRVSNEWYEEKKELCRDCRE